MSAFISKINKFKNPSGPLKIKRGLHTPHSVTPFIKNLPLLHNNSKCFNLTSLNCIVHVDIKTSEWEVLSLIPAAGVTFTGLRAGDPQQRHLRHPQHKDNMLDVN